LTPPDSKHCGGAVERVTSGDESSTRLQRILDRRWTVSNLPVDPEDRSDGYETVNVGGTVQRVKADDVLALLLYVDLNDRFILFRDQQARRVRRLQHVDEHVVGQHIEFLHDFSLHVCLASDAVSTSDKNGKNNKNIKLEGVNTRFL
jgi:hypothetical protein